MSQPPAASTEMIALDNAALALKPPDEQRQRQREQGNYLGWEQNDSNFLLVVATLVTGLTYQLGTNLPGGYYQDDNNGHQAGDSILHDKHYCRYWLFMIASRAGFVSSMSMTLALLTGVSRESRRIRWPFLVAYPSLVLAFFTSQLNNSLWIDCLFWVVVVIITEIAIHPGHLFMFKYFKKPS